MSKETPMFSSSDGKPNQIKFRVHLHLRASLTRDSVGITVNQFILEL